MPNKYKTDIFQACRDEDYDLVVFFVEVVRLDLSLRDKFGKTALHYANQTKNKNLIHYVKTKLEAQTLEKKNKALRKSQPQHQHHLQSPAPDKFSKSPLPSLADDDMNTLMEGIKDMDSIQEKSVTQNSKAKPSSIIKKAELNIENVTKNDVSTQQEVIDDGDSLNGSAGSVNPDLEALSNLFPEISVEVLQIVLQDSQGSLEFAVEMLLDGQHTNKSQNKISSSSNRVNKNGNFAPVINSAADFPSLSTKKKNKQKKKKASQPLTENAIIPRDENQNTVIEPINNDKKPKDTTPAVDNDSSAASDANKPDDETHVTHVLSESNLKTFEIKRTEHEHDEGSEFEHVEQDGEWSEIEDGNGDVDDDDLDIQSVPESDITDDWDIYFNQGSPENDHWEDVENPDVKVNKVDESEWIVKDELDKSYANVVRSSPLSLASTSHPTPATIHKSPIKLTPVTQASSLEIFVNNEGVHVLTSDTGKKKKSQVEYHPEEEFYITKEGRVYGKASKTNKGTSSKIPQVKVGRPAGSAKVL